MPLRCLSSQQRRRPAFQSQTRSRPSCHLPGTRRMLIGRIVSISNEKPPQLPLMESMSAMPAVLVSISNEKPPQLPLSNVAPEIFDDIQFQSQTRSRPSCHTADFAISFLDFLVSISNEKPPQLPHGVLAVAERRGAVSISNEKPPQLPPSPRSRSSPRGSRFNLKREAAPVATNWGSLKELPIFLLSFNLKREAAPVATCSSAAWQH